MRVYIGVAIKIIKIAILKKYESKVNIFLTISNCILLQTTYIMVFFMFNNLRWEMIVHFVDMCWPLLFVLTITVCVDHHCLCWPSLFVLTITVWAFSSLNIGMFEDTKGVIRIRKSYDWQYNGQRKRTNNDK